MYCLDWQAARGLWAICPKRRPLTHVVSDGRRRRQHCNDSHLRLVDSSQTPWNDGAHFFAVCSRRALKRVGNLRIAALDEAMAFDARKSQVLEMRIFGGLSAKETTNVLRISTDTVTREMHLATASLRREPGREDWDGARTLA